MKTNMSEGTRSEEQAVAPTIDELRTAHATPRVTDLLVELSGPDSEATTQEQRRKRLDRALDSGEYSTKERITLAAVEAILDQGIHTAPVDSIAARARVSKGAVFYSFGSRDALITHVLGTLVDVLALTIAEARADLRGREALEQIFRAVLTLTVSNRVTVHTIFAEITRPDSQWDIAEDALRRGVYEPLAEVLRETGRFSATPSFEVPLPECSPEAQRLRVTLAAIVGAIFLVGQALETDGGDAAMVDGATNYLLEIASK